MRTLLIVMACLTTCTAFSQIQCSNDSTGLIPLVDLGAGYYMGHQGGLFPGCSNTLPLAHKKKGIGISKALKPLDTLGNVNYEEGKIIFLGLGGWHFQRLRIYSQLYIITNLRSPDCVNPSNNTCRSISIRCGNFLRYFPHVAVEWHFLRLIPPVFL